MLMKMEITAEDLKLLRGKFIIQVNNDDHDPFNNQSRGFLMEKRISFLNEIDVREYPNGAGWVLSGFYYNHSKVLTTEEMVNRLNNDRNPERHHRLLTPKELEIVTGWMREDLLEI